MPTPLINGERICGSPTDSDADAATLPTEEKIFHDRGSGSEELVDNSPSPNKKGGQGIYYAVKVGYAWPPPLGDDDENIDNDTSHETQPNKKRKRESSQKNDDDIDKQQDSPVKVQSAIFLFWEDAKMFVESSNSPDHKAEYAAFESLKGAKDYLIGGEKESARNVPVVAEKALPSSVARKQKPRGNQGVKKSGMEAERLLAPHIPTIPQIPLGGFAPLANPFLDPMFAGFINSGVLGGMGPPAAAARRPPGKPSETTTKPLAANDQSTDNINTQDNLAENDPVNDDPNSADENEKNDPSKSTKKRVDNWHRMFRSLQIYKDANEGSVEIPEILAEDKDKPEKKGLGSLRKWCNAQIQNYRRYSQGYEMKYLSEDKIEKLKGIGMQLGPSYDEMFGRLTAYKAETGTLEISEEDDGELYEWTKHQKNFLARHFAGRPCALSDDRIQSLIPLGYERGYKKRTRKSLITDSATLAAAEESDWNAKLEELVQYKEKYGNFIFRQVTTEHNKPERMLKYWVLEQRREFKKLQRGQESKLTARRLQKLNDIGFELKTKSEIISWEDRLRMLREFKEEHGHCKPTKLHPFLNHLVGNIRQQYRDKQKGAKTPLTDERVRQLEEVGFVFKAGKSPVQVTVRKTWDERFQELLAFKEEHGHCLVPQLSGSLGQWVKKERDGYRWMKQGRKTHMTPERALKLTEIGFCWNAAQYRGSNRINNKKSTHEEEDADADYDYYNEMA